MLTDTQSTNVAIVTGAGQGIGRAIVDRMIRAGITIIAVDQNEDGLKQLQCEHDNIFALQGDISDSALLDALETLLTSNGLSVDILVNNAGIARGSHALDTSLDDLSRYFEINIKGTFQLSKFVLPYMLRSGGGSIVNIASVFGLVGAQNSAGYSMSKAAVIGMTRQMATDFGPSGVRINAVAPGLIVTPLTEARIKTELWRRQIMIEQCPLQRAGTVEDIANAVFFLSSKEASFITGHTLVVDGGWTLGRYPRKEAIYGE
ncbi:SDR family NAD(P)-dependent oxidoreductase [Pelistega europaea]|uniref:SDR family oxidoreductase n=1 Tax=Pelistega europaea TaxID=106147 RepID=A0A7Y4P5B8_9BURK|nr:SDR family oxidoreductase [Pelistega europaea]NOL48585.1 SDR family oxidoreductase [Pelistega europaea]